MRDKLRRYYERRHDAACYGRWIWKESRDWIPVILLISVINGLLSIAGIGIAAVNKELVDRATGTQPFFGAGIFLLLITVTVGNVVVSSGIGLYTGFLNEKFSFTMRRNFYGKILRGDWLRLSSYHSGDLMTRLTGDIDTVSNSLFILLPAICYMVLQFVTAFALLYHYDPGLTVIALCIGPLGLAASVALGRLFGRYQKQFRENDGQFRSFMQESMENLMVIKSFSQEEQFGKRLNGYWEARFDIILRRSRASFWLNLAIRGIFSGGYLIAFGWSILRLSRGEITYGTMTLLLTLVSQIQSPIRSLQSTVQYFVGMLVSAGRIMEVMEIPQEAPKGQAQRLHGAVGIRAEGICFSYSDDGKKVLDRLNFHIKPGETVGIVGESGAGKTTIVRLLLALTEPGEGSLVFYDRNGKTAESGVGIRDMTAYVPQGNTLMSGTIRDNLLLASQEADETELWNALETAEAREFVEQLPQGLDSRILEKGGAISEGQAQRLAIARAVLKKAPLLILDEATASLDMETEAKIVSNLKNLAGDPTCVVITHRMSLLDICERIFTLRDGKIVEMEGAEA